MRKFALHALVALAAAGIAGCGILYPAKPKPTGAAQVTRAEPLPAAPPTQVSQQPERHKSKRTASKSTHSSTPDRQASNVSGNQAPEATAPSEAAAPSLTLAGESTSRAEAQLLVDKADRSLAKIDRSKLSASDVTTYYEASGFVSSAQHALDDNDYFAASGLAQKASVLTGRLAR